MKNFVLSISTAVGLVLCATTAFAQDASCITKQQVVEYYHNEAQASVAFEDSDTVVLSSPLVDTVLENEFDAAGCLTTQNVLDSVHFNLKYGEGV